MTAPSNANTSGLEYYGFRAFNAGIGVCHLVANPGLNDTNPEPLVTAASAQARIAELEARVAELEAAKWDVKHVDTMNDMVAMGLARDAADARADRLEAALIEALPFVESCEYDNGYKPGAVLRVVKNIQSALQQEG